MAETTGEFGERMNGIPKVVVSTTLTEATWNNTTIISEDVPGEVAALKGDTRATFSLPAAPCWSTRCAGTTWSTSTA